MTFQFSRGSFIVLLSVLVGFIATPALARQTRGKMEGNVYVAPIGNYRCEIPNYDPRDIKIKDRFGPAGGSAAFNSSFNITRVDVEQIEGGTQPEDLEWAPMREFLTYYFRERIVPLVKSGVKEATVVSNEFHSGPVLTYRSVMKLPLSKRNGGDKLRGAIQYSDGNFMYTVSVTRDVKADLGLSESEDAEKVMKETEGVFTLCHFPAPANTTPVTTEPSA